MSQELLCNQRNPRLQEEVGMVAGSQIIGLSPRNSVHEVIHGALIQQISYEPLYVHFCKILHKPIYEDTLVFFHKHIRVQHKPKKPRNHFPLRLKFNARSQGFTSCEELK